MKRLALLAVVSLFPTLSSAVEMGLGASARSDEATVYLPINLNPGLRIEPFFSFGSREVSTGASTTEINSRQLGVGAFGRLDAHERLQPYFGGRLAYLQEESAGSDLDGFRIEPGIGVEFFVTERVSVGLEAFLFYQDLDGNTGPFAAEDESTGNGTRLLLRIMP